MCSLSDAVRAGSGRSVWCVAGVVAAFVVHSVGISVTGLYPMLIDPNTGRITDHTITMVLV